MFVKRVYTLLRLSVPQSHCLIVATGDIRRLFGENFAGCCGHSNRTGTFGDSLATPDYHGNRKNGRRAIIRYTISGTLQYTLVTAQTRSKYIY